MGRISEAVAMRTKGAINGHVARVARFGAVIIEI
jgi:hypothetical protein